MKIISDNIEIPRKKRSLTHIPKEKLIEETVDTAPYEKYVDTLSNTSLKGVHLLEVIDDLLKDIVIPVNEDNFDVRTAVIALDPEVPEGDYIRFSFYKNLIEGVYEDLLQTATNLPTLLDGNQSKKDITVIDKISRKRGIDPKILKLLMSGNSAMFVKLLSDVMKPYIATVAAQCTETPNPVAVAALQIPGALLSIGLDQMNRELAKLAETTETKTTTEKKKIETTDPIEKAFIALKDESSEILILNYVEEFISSNYEDKYAPWLLYEDVYSRVITLYNRILIYSGNRLSTVTQFPPEVKETVKNSISKKKLKSFRDYIKPFYYGINVKENSREIKLIEDTEKGFDKIAAALSDKTYVQNAICCLFKYFVNIDLKFLKKIYEVLKYTKRTLSVYTGFSNSRTIDIFTDYIEYEIDELTASIKNGIRDSLLDSENKLNETIACFAVNDFVHLLLDIVDEISLSLKVFVEQVEILHTSLFSELGEKVSVVIESKNLTFFIEMLKYIIDQIAACEVENRDDPRAPYKASNYVSNYINPSLTKFKTPSFGNIIELTDKNSYLPGTQIIIDDKAVIVGGQKPLDQITLQTYVSCQDKASDYAGSYDI